MTLSEPLVEPRGELQRRGRGASACPRGLEGEPALHRDPGASVLPSSLTRRVGGRSLAGTRRSPKASCAAKEPGSADRLGLDADDDPRLPWSRRSRRRSRPRGEPLDDGGLEHGPGDVAASTRAGRARRAPRPSLAVLVRRASCSTPQAATTSRSPDLRRRGTPGARSPRSPSPVKASAYGMATPARCGRPSSTAW